MTDYGYNGCPPTPDGVDREAHNSSADEQHIAPLGNNGSTDEKKRRALSPAIGLVCCAVGGAVSSSDAALLTGLLVGYGFVAATQHRTLKERLIAIVVTFAAAAAAGAFSGIAYVASGLVTSLLGIVVALLATEGRLTTGSICLIVAAFSLANIGVEEAIAYSYGTSIGETMEELLSDYAELLDMTSASTVLAYQYLSNVYTMLWPVAYVLSVVIEYVLAHLGARLAANQMGEDAPKMLALADFDLPFWALVVFVAALAVAAIEATVDALSSEILLLVSANVLMAMRFALTAQGIGVLLWFMRDRHVGSFWVWFVSLIALYLEIQFYVMALVGLVDSFANFRHFPRGKRVTIQSGEQQD